MQPSQPSVLMCALEGIRHCFEAVLVHHHPSNKALIFLKYTVILNLMGQKNADFVN